ncbi:3-oxoacyl-[acyl-carrier-protein] synthase [Arthrobotrys conoides]|uniref:Fatty acid synthase subunit alpha n=1 Tax=Arthrobotrys conoides TaxID=74498 RepID=A0AAN8P711_9PEZI
MPTHEQEQELSHLLLIELLAYQFASPVRWIETQDVILSEQRAERIVEVGPADTLAGMARRTLAAKYEAYDAALSLQRQVLSYNKDGKEIYYQAEPEAEEPEPTAASSAPTASSSSSSAAPTAAAVAAPPPPSAGPAAAVPDAPVTATDVVRSLIAQKLKKSLADIPLSKAIKDLVGGKSTLQNEILGDLQKEFGSTPEKPEDTPLDELGAAMQATFNGQLGKHSSSLIARMISSKMPGGFNMTSARKYLETRWGLGPGRQDGVLLMAITAEPAARLGSDNDAKAFFDDITQKYAAASGVSLSSPAAGGAAAAGAGMMVDPAALDALTKDQKALFKQQLEILARYLKMDLTAGDKAHIGSKESQAVLQAQLDLWNAEHGDYYAEGIAPIFSSLKARIYDSSWNWVRQDALTMYYDVVFGRLKLVDRDIVSHCIRIMNRSNPTLLDFMQYNIDHTPTERGETYKLAKELAGQLLSNCIEALNADPVYKDVDYPTGPQTTIDNQGNLSYAEVTRPAVRKLEHYVKEMAAGGKVSEYGNKTKVQQDLQKVYKIIRQQHKLSKNDQLQIKQLYSNVYRALAMNEGQLFNDRKTKKGARSIAAAVGKSGDAKMRSIPFLHLKSRSGQEWGYSKKLTGVYLDTLEKAAVNGISFTGRNVLITGAGAGSIGSRVLEGLLSGGARVIVTTSRFSRETTEYYQATYSRYGAKGSCLVVVPFNQGSKQDIDSLVNYIYDTKKGLGWDLDHIIPFAAIPENGREIDGIDSKSELAHRIELTNVIRLIGAVKAQKHAAGIQTRPAQVVLPLSPNHGTFGNDGLYSESKLGLETLFNRWHSESWASYLTICGAVIGWTRGTGLMNMNNITAEAVEKLGVRTFSGQEMAFNLLGLMAPNIVNLCQVEPVFADLNGALHFLPNLKDIMSSRRAEIMATSEVRQAVTRETSIEHKVINGDASAELYKKITVAPRANMKFEFPELPEYKSLEPLAQDLRGMVDLEKVVVVTGFAEIGPWGNSRTRWEMEAYGKFSLEGCVEMAWIMGLIKNHNGPLKGKHYSGWVDAKTSEPVDDKDIKAKYEAQILEHSGIRLIEPELFGGYDPNKKEILQEIVIQEDLDPFEASKETAEEFRRRHNEFVETFEIVETGEWTIRIKKGATLLVPKALKFDRLVAGQIPTGWNAKQYGIPDDIIGQVDRVTLYLLVCVVEGLLSSGITDPYEFYKYVHVSELGNCVGSGVGGVNALKSMYKDRWADKPVQKDILQESFINTMSAWVNMLLLSSSGPIKSPSGACATAIESVDIGYDTIVSGKAKCVLVGGFDDFQEEASYEFANMKATSNAEEEFAHGRTPGEMSRPTTTTRAGFMEAQGCGIQVLMSAKLALEMGVPIYSIVALTATATDKTGRSIPAPGRGIMTTARETSSRFPSPLLDIKYRKRQLEARKQQIKSWTESEIMYLQDEVAALKASGELEGIAEREYVDDRAKHIEREAKRQESEALNSWGNEFWKNDPKIAPLRGALATWGLTIDDLDVASLHGTSTVANDKNESKSLNDMLGHLGRSKGNALLVVCQKFLTGHPKGAAGAWMMNGAIQVLNSGLVPGNRNADNVDKVFEQFSYLLFPSRSLQTDGIKAFSVTSFGFGQKGAQAVGVHPKYLFATLDEQTYENYKAKVEARHKKAYRYFHSSLCNNNMFVAKNSAPYTPELETSVYLDPLARVTPDKKSGSYSFSDRPPKKASDPDDTRKVVEQLALASVKGSNSKIGVDVELLSSINIENENFIERNFTKGEQEYCRQAPNPQASFAGRWSAKEAVWKTLGVESKGAGAPLVEIEIERDDKGAPVVKLHGDALAAAEKNGIKDVQVTISHSDVQAIAVAVSTF